MRAGGNPFDPTLGYLALEQDGDDTLLNIDFDGVDGTVILPSNGGHSFKRTFGLQMPLD